MLSDHFVFAVVQFRIGCLKRPSDFSVCRSLARVDLRTCGMSVHDDFQSRRDLNRVRNIGSGFSLCGCLSFYGCEPQHQDEANQSGRSGEGWNEFFHRDHCSPSEMYSAKNNNSWRALRENPPSSSSVSFPSSTCTESSPAFSSRHTMI